jgi:hypothetical protein
MKVGELRTRLERFHDEADIFAYVKGDKRVLRAMIPKKERDEDEFDRQVREFMEK